MKAKMDECLEKFGPKQRMRRASNIDFIEMMSVSHLDYAKAALTKLVTLVTNLARIRERCETLDNERNQALIMIGVESPNEKVYLTTSLRDKMAEHEHIISRLEIELQEVNAELQSKKHLEYVVEELDNTKTAMEALKTELQQKDNQNKRLNDELTKANKSLAVAKYQASKKQNHVTIQRPPSPRHGRAPSPRHVSVTTPNSQLRTTARTPRIATPFNKVDIGKLGDNSSGGSDDDIEEIKPDTLSPQDARLAKPRALMPHATTNSQGVTLPPLSTEKEKPKLDFRFLKENQHNQKGRPVKPNMATPGATRISTMSSGEPTYKKPAGILSISSVNGPVHSTSLDTAVKARPAKQPRFNNLLTTQAGFEMKRSNTLYR